MRYIIYNKTGKILRVVECSPTLAKIQAHDNEFIMKGDANDATQKIVNGKVVNKTPEEIEAVDPNPPILEIPKDKQLVFLTNKMWQDVLKRLSNLEAHHE